MLVVHHLPGTQVTHAKASSNCFDIPFSLDGIPIPKKFIDRPVEMRLLEQELLPRSESDQRKVFVLRGLGGIGKTQLAVQFMRRHHTRFSAALWLDGSSEDSLKQSIARHASKIPSGQISDAGRTYTRTGEGDVDAVAQEVLVWLAQPANNRWLLTFDNVDRDFNPELNLSQSDPLAYDVTRFIPIADHGSILVTTRLAQLEQLGESQEVKKVDERTAHEILKSWDKRSHGKERSSITPLFYTR